MPPLVGRRRELHLLEDGLESAVGGRGRLLLVSGDPGIGKTRLCEELAEVASARGVGVAWTRCWDSRSVPAFWSWERLLAQLTDEALPDPRPVAATDDPDAARLRYFDDVVEVVRRVASVRPRVLVIDDLHWADVASVRLLGYLASLLRDMAVLVLTTYRDVEARPETPLGEALLDLGRYGSRIHLDGMAVEHIPELIGSGEVDVAAAVHHHTGGNPLFALELARLLEAQGGLGRLVAGDLAPVPATVRGVLARRLDTVSAPCRTVLEVAAVTGDEIDLDPVAAVTGMDRDQLLDAVDEALGARLLRRAGVATYAFNHPLVRATVYEDLRVARRVRLHERVGLALESLRQQGRDVDPAALAHHFLQAAPGGAAVKAAGYALEAASRAMAHLAYESAVAFYEQALAALELHPPAADRCEVLLGLGGALLAAGRLPEARAVHLEASALARAAGRADQLARAALGIGGGGGFEVALGDREQIDALEEARLALGPGPSVLLAEVTARLSVALSLTGAEERRLALSEEAESMARACGDPGALAYALAAHCDAIAGPAYTERRLAESAEIIALARSRSDRATELLGRRFRLVALLELGDMAGADAEIEAYARLADLVRLPLYAWYVPLWRAMRAFVRGDLEGCARLVDEAAALGAQTHSENAEILTDSLRWYLHREAGDAQAALAGLDRLVPFEAVFGAQFRVPMTLMLSDAGRLDEARARLDADAAAIWALPVDSEWLPMMIQLAQCIAATGGHSLAGWAYEALLPHRRLFGVEGIGAAWTGSVERALGLLAASLGRRQEAAEHFDAAVAANRAAGSPLFVEVTRRDARRVLGDGGPANVFRREGDVWVLGYEGRTVWLKDVKGLRDLAVLVAQPGRDVAAADLAGAPGGPRQAGLGDVLDEQAREAYKARLVQLEVELDRADASGDSERSAAAEEERAAILAQLAGAYGLAGRPRRTGDDSERARQAVTWRIRDALGRIDAAHPELGDHLRRSVRTGTFCAYDPVKPVHWST